MRRNLIRYLCVSMLLLSALSQGRDLKTDDQVAQVIQMTAKKYEFSPSQVHVKLGMKVQLKITAIDRNHGFTIVRDTVGDDSTTHPCLLFTLPVGSDGWRLNRGKETTIEFVCQSTRDIRVQLLAGLRHSPRSYEGSSHRGSMRMAQITHFGVGLKLNPEPGT